MAVKYMSSPVQTLHRTYHDKPILVVFFKKGSFYDYPLSRHEYLQSYKDFFKRAKRHFSIFVVRGAQKYRGNGVFSNGYFFKHGKFVNYPHIIAARVIYDKDSEGSLPAQTGKEWAIINHPLLSRRLLYKDLTYQKFGQFMKPLFYVKNRKDCMHALQKIQTPLAVFKPRTGYGGKGIVIAEKKILLNKLKNYNGLLGEFIDSANGIPGFVRSRHDLRITIADGTIIEVLVRIPKKGSLLANISQGASAQQFPPSRVPARVRNIVKKIDKRLSQFGHRLYSIDFLYEKNKPYMVEMNARPGLPFKQWGAVYSRWHKGLLQVIKNAEKDINQTYGI